MNSSFRVTQATVLMLLAGFSFGQDVDRTHGFWQQAASRYPSWSPDGRKIAFIACRPTGTDGGTRMLYVANADGTDVVNMTSKSGQRVTELYPRWNRAGTRVSVLSFRRADWRFFEVNFPNAEYREPLPEGKLIYTGSLDWGKNDEEVAFSAATGRSFEIFVYSLASKQLAQLTKDDATDIQPCFSPNGDRIAFVSNREGLWDIYVVSRDGSGVMNVTANEAADIDPAWKPDGTQIAFASNRDGSYQIYILDLKSKSTRQLTSSKENNGWPAWSPDGKRIAFESNREGVYQIYVIDVDSGSEKLLIPARRD